jgi:hypothetical protein
MMHPVINMYDVGCLIYDVKRTSKSYFAHLASYFVILFFSSEGDSHCVVKE